MKFTYVYIFRACLADLRRLRHILLSQGECPPYYFADLEDEIDQNTCVVIVDSHGVEFKCKKFQPGKRWVSWCAYDSSDEKWHRKAATCISAGHIRTRKRQQGSRSYVKCWRGQSTADEAVEAQPKTSEYHPRACEAELTAERNIARSWRQEPESWNIRFMYPRREWERQLHLSPGNVSNANWTAWKRCNITRSMRHDRSLSGAYGTADNKSAFGKSHVHRYLLEHLTALQGQRIRDRQHPRHQSGVGLDHKAGIQNVLCQRVARTWFHQLKQKANPQERLIWSAQNHWLHLKYLNKSPFLLKTKATFFRLKLPSALSAYNAGSKC